MAHITDWKSPQTVTCAGSVSFTYPSDYLLPIVGANIILEAGWLAMLGPHMVDYSTCIIKFYHNGQFINLKRSNAIKPHSTIVYQLQHLYSIREIYARYTLALTTLSSCQTSFLSWLTRSSYFPLYLTTTIHKDSYIFALPSGLPSSHACNHKIPLLQHSAFVKINLYRYPHS